MPPTRRSTRPAAAPARPYARTDTRSSDSDSPAPAAKARTARSTRNPRALIEPDSDDEEMEDYDQAIQAQIDDDDDDDDDDDQADDDEDHMDEEEDAEGDNESDEGIMDDPAPPRIQQTAGGKGRTTVTIKPPAAEKLKSVEAQEVGGDDDELSDLDSEDNDMDDENDDEGEDEEDEDEDNDSDASGSGTPDPSKLTRRQRGPVDEPGADLMALSNEAQARKHISAEEHAMRRAEMARRRKNLSEKRNEEEKIDTINKLLKKPAPKRRTRAEILAAQAAGEGGTPGIDGEDAEEPKADSLYVRWVNNKSGSTIGVPDEWLAAPVGSIFAQDDKQTAPGVGAHHMVEEVA